MVRVAGAEVGWKMAAGVKVPGVCKMEVIVRMS